ncbi:protein TIME FOR COFFEE-like [Prosopis cineraria]|uniref:protein TIME FOR COFFEE-like n=1 Tax=Prosopis cineraria TaxID=364024 RepID=UPI00240F2296|nr:protein TIME FOR COFFEE-like [Prosopis cineraria]XP_054814674.1 protein TIME FOR COFFEE-like [Prosopis cineraria]
MEDKEERPTKEMKMDASNENYDVIKIDLEVPMKDDGILTRDTLEEDNKQEQPPEMTNYEVKKTVSLSSSVPAWSRNLPPLGYVPPTLQPIVKTDKTIGSSAALQLVDFVLSPSPPKRCATHHYIARSIFLHQQLLRANHIEPAAVNSSSLCGTKPSNVNGVPTPESMIIGKQSQNDFPGVNENATQVKNELAASKFPSLDTNKGPDASSSLDSMQMEQKGPYRTSAGNLMHQPSLATIAASHARGGNSSYASSSDNSISFFAGSLGETASVRGVSPAPSYALAQPSYLNSSTSIDLSSSHKKSSGVNVSANTFCPLP